MVRTQEISFPQTESAFSLLAANSRMGAGDHLDYHLTSGDITLELGSELFDPAYHDLEDVDFGLEEGIATDELYVPAGLTVRPLMVGVAQDLMTRSEDPRIKNLKKVAADRIVASVQAAVPQTDPINGVAVTDLQVSAFDFHEVAKVSDRAEGVRKIEDIAMNGLTVVVSDFHKMTFAEGSLDGTVAVKVNHVLERQIPRDIEGVISLGNGVELNTRKTRQVNKYNQALAKEHTDTVDAISRAGGQVISVVIDPRFYKPLGFDAARTDRDLAGALTQIN